jgi:hypothetical protein
MMVSIGGMHILQSLQDVNTNQEGKPMSPRITLTCRVIRSPKRSAAPASLAGFALTALALIFMLSACGGTASSAGVDNATMTQAAKLALGTINLEGTDQAVDAEHASQLLPLWQLFSDLSASTSAAPEELAAVVQEIEATMTADQFSAIKAMNLSDTESAAVTQGAGTSPAVSSGDARAGTQSAQVVMDPALGGEMGGGMPPDGGMPMDGSMPGGDTQPSSGSSSAVASAAAPGNMSSAALFQRVVALLQSKLQR